MEGLPGPRKGLIGPWSHAWPYKVTPGPAIGFLQDTLRWWDHWLKGIDTGHHGRAHAARLDGGLRGAGAGDRRASRPLGGRARVAVAARSSARTWSLNDGTIDDAAGAETRVDFRGLQLTGIDAGAWCTEGAPGDWPTDQRAEDGRSLTWDSAPLGDRLEILGFPEVTLDAGRRQAHGAHLRAPQRRGPRRHVQARHAPGAQPHPPRRPRVPRGARARRALSPSPSSSTAIAHAFARRSPAARRRLDRLLAVGLAVARGRSR